MVEQACTPSPAYLAVLDGLPPRVFVLDGSPVVIGRSPEAELHLNHFEVSRRHCRLHFEGKAWLLRDLASRWGTKINGAPVTAATALEAGDKVSLGAVLLLFGAGEPPGDLEKLRAGCVEAGPMAVLAKGRAVTCIPLGGHVTMGRGEESDVVLGDLAVSRRHALIQRDATGFRVVDLKSKSGSFVNGRRFDEHGLVIGDRLAIGPFFFQFDGSVLNRIASVSGGSVYALEVVRNAGGAAVLKGITLNVAACRFVGILGPSGAGKSSLLDVLSGLKPPTSGRVFFDGIDIHASRGAAPAGYVPQEDLVHPALTIHQALSFSARLRLPQTTPPAEIEKLIAQTVLRLGLKERAGTAISRLSGGERKRVSVAVELLARPALLFLDEPTSGLDPATEFKLMELLRGLADTGCTVVCTTHVMENVHLMDRIAVLLGGRLVFDGSPREARDYFGVPRLAALYDRLEERPPELWERDFREAFGRGQEKPLEKSASRESGERARSRGASAFFQIFKVLIERQIAILVSDWRNLVLLLAQPVFIGVIVSWVSRDASLDLFFGYIATLWFGCSNGAQEIVSEIPIYRRERIVGVGKGVYVAGKFVFLAVATSLQALILYGCLRGTDGSAAWQCAGLCGMAFAAAGMGLGISALARSATQAAFIVPIALIPLILFSGYTVPASTMKPSVFAVSRLTPTLASQTLMDTSFLWYRRVEREVLSDHWDSFRNLNRDNLLRTGELYRQSRPAVLAILTLGVWAMGGCAAALLGLKAHEKR